MLKAQFLIRKQAQIAQARKLPLRTCSGKFIMRLPYRQLNRNSHLEKEFARPTLLADDDSSWSSSSGMTQDILGMPMVDYSTQIPDLFSH